MTDRMDELMKKQGRKEVLAMRAEAGEVQLQRDIVPGQWTPVWFDEFRRENKNQKWEPTGQRVHQETVQCLRTLRDFDHGDRLSCSITYEQAIEMIQKARNASHACRKLVPIVDIFMLMLRGLKLFRVNTRLPDSNQLAVCFTKKP